MANFALLTCHIVITCIFGPLEFCLWVEYWVCSTYINTFAGICTYTAVAFCKILLDFNLKTMAHSIYSPDSFVYDDNNVLRRLEPPPSEDYYERGVLPVLRLRNRLTALIVDGSSFCRLALKVMLRHYGVETEDVENGQPVLDLIAKRPDHFDLIFIDVPLPSIYNEIDDIRALRARGITSKVVGIISCNCPPVREGNMCGCLPDIVQVLDAGASEVIFKPVSIVTLVSILRDLDNQF